MPDPTTTTINRDQRDGLYEVIRNHLALVQDFWVAMERTKDGTTAERLGLEFAEDFRLMEVLRRLHDEAAQILIASGTEAQASQEDAGTNPAIPARP